MKTLFFGLNWIGDVVMSFPALAAAAGQDGLPVDVLTRPALGPVYTLSPAVGEVVGLDTKQPFWNLLPELIAIRRRRYDRIVVLPRSFRSAFLAFLCGGVRRRGFTGEGRGLFLNDPASVPPWADAIHESRLHLALTDGTVSGSRPADGPAPVPELKSIPPADAETVRKKLGLNNTTDYIVIAPGAAFGEIKRWPAERFAALGRHLRDRYGVTIAVSGSPAESRLTSKIACDIGAGAVDLAGRTALDELFGLLAGARLLACNDSGTMHLGAALGAPLVVPVGPTDMARTGPMSGHAAIVRGRPCPGGTPCRRRECRYGTRICMESVSVDAVTAAADNLLAKGKGTC